MTPSLQPEQLRDALRAVIDPEIFENIIDLGLVYNVEVEPADRAVVTMTFTTPHCPMGPEIVENVEKTLKAQGAQSVAVNIVWDPMWTPDMMTDALKKQMGIEPEAELKIETPPPPPPTPRKKEKKGFFARIFGG